MANVRFDTTEEEVLLIGKIADRAKSLGLLSGWYKRMTLVMDMTATNANGCPMDFARLLDADNLNFVHDVAGIANHIDRDTGKLANYFLPRFAKPETVAA